jgi:sterol desaturase/sphingolipid hydroxylase (fatty acid hydroxylase superfamily)
MINQLFSSAIWLVSCAGLFSALQYLFPHDKAQRAVRSDSWIDVFYWILVPFGYALASSSLLVAGFFVLFQGDLDAALAWSQNGADWLKGWPFWAQVLGVLVVTDISMYWTHRLFHQGNLWKYHAIHHAPESLDWLHSVRFHPVNMVFHGILANALAMWIGFPPLAVAALGPFNILYSCMVHANLNWTFGPLRYVFASPVFHRWHHTSAEEGGSKNFAATFSCLDLLFGTFSMPKPGEVMKTGLTERDMPATLIGQLLYPFNRPKPAAGAARSDVSPAQ